MRNKKAEILYRLQNDKECKITETIPKLISQLKLNIQNQKNEVLA
jgi:hypothetical protein